MTVTLSYKISLKSHFGYFEMRIILETAEHAESVVVVVVVAVVVVVVLF